MKLNFSKRQIVKVSENMYPFQTNTHSQETEVTQIYLLNNFRLTDKCIMFKYTKFVLNFYVKLIKHSSNIKFNIYTF